MALTFEEKKERKNMIGGSDIGPICGKSKYKGPRDIYLDKITPIDEDVEEEENIPAEIGSELEPWLIRKYTQRTGKNVKDAPIKRHPSYDYMVARVDGLIEDGGILEVKTTCSNNYFKEWGTPGTDEIPDAYKLQCAFYALIYDAPYVDIIVGISHFSHPEIHIYRYNRHEKLEQSIVKIAKNFWENCVLKKTPPAALSAQETLRYNSRLQVDGNSSAIASPEILSVYTELLNLIEKEKEISVLVDEKKAILADFISSNEILIDTIGQILITYKNTSRKTFDSKKFKSDHPDLYENFIKTTQSRTFRVAKGNNDEC